MSQSSPSSPPPRRKLGRNGGVALICGVVFVGMVGAAYASVPLYRAFCQVTGYGGTVREQTDQTVRIGETAVATFKVTNRSDKPVTARAVFNVVPEQAAVYFRKLSCFCFSDQTVAAGQTVEMPVLYFVDPKYTEDFETRNGKTITLSYTFYPAVDAKPQTAAAETKAN